MSYQLATAKIWNGSAWVNASQGADLFAPTNGSAAPYVIASATANAGTTLNTKGAWIQIIASTSEDAHKVWISVSPTFVSTQNSSILMDIGIGAAGAETVILPNIAIGYQQNTFLMDVPLYIPSGTRIAARIQAATSGRTASIGIGLSKSYRTLYKNPSTSATSWGLQSTASRGLGVAPNATANVDGNWYVFTTDTGVARKWIGFGVQGNSNTALQASSILLDVGIGAAGSETVIISDIRLATTTSEVVNLNSFVRGFYVDIPANSRLVVRMQSSVANGPAIDITATAVEEVGSA